MKSTKSWKVRDNNSRITISILSLFLLFIVILSICLFIFFKRYKVYQVKSKVMENTFFKGETVLLDKSAFTDSPIKRNELVVYDRVSMIYIGRIIGLPGDTVEIKNKTVYINGDSLKESSTVKHNEKINLGPEPIINSKGPIIISKDVYLLLYDYRNIRGIATPIGIPRKSIIGKPSLIIWSNDFSRIGKIPK